MQVIMKLILIIGLATLASATAMSDPDPVVSVIKASKLDPKFPEKFQGMLERSINTAGNHIRELRPANYTLFYKQPNGEIDVTVIASFGAMTVKGMGHLELYGDVALAMTKNRKLYVHFFLKGQPLKFDARVIVSSMGMATQFDVFGRIPFRFFTGVTYHKYASKPSVMLEFTKLNEPALDLDAFVPKWLNRTTMITESVKELLPFTKTFIVNEFSKHVLQNLNFEEVEDTLNKFRNSN